MLLEEVIEMRHFGKAECVGDLGDIPIGVPQEDFGLLDDALGNKLRSGLLGGGFDGAVEMVHVHVQLPCKIGRRTQPHGRMTVVNGELTLEQFHKEHGDALGSVDGMHFPAGRLQFQREMHELKNEVPYEIEFILVVGVQLAFHFEKDGFDL